MRLKRKDNKMFDAVILMAGQGLRSGLDINKVFYKIKPQCKITEGQNRFK